uniref:Uncharacterized protein n=1 Tax=Romanomermis culicivorax TaxID=13658 RepID=A0A915J9H7_ROMCU
MNRKKSVIDTFDSPFILADFPKRVRSGNVLQCRTVFGHVGHLLGYILGIWIGAVSIKRRLTTQEKNLEKEIDDYETMIIH